MAIDGRLFGPRDRAVLILMVREAILAARSTRRADAAWILVGGGLLVAYAVGDGVIALLAAADALRGRDALWWMEMPAACSALGAAAGLALGRAAVARAHMPFLAALPLSKARRRRMAAFAVTPFGACAASLVAALAAGVAGLVGRPVPPVAGTAFAAFAAGFCLAGLHAVRRTPPATPGTGRDPARRGLPAGFVLRLVDRPGLAWVGCWAWNIAGGRLRPTVRLALASAAVASGVILSAGASLARRDVRPATAVAVLAGVAVFMVALRCRPLASPTLRSAPVGFLRAWARLMRLPALLSAAVFLLPAGAALAAEPAAWTVPASGALCVAGLNLVYAVFAAAFVASPTLAALSFLATLGYAAYEAVEYGAGVSLAVAAMVVVLFRGARRRFRHG